MVNKNLQLQYVEHAIAILEGKGPLCQKDVEIHRDLIALRENIKEPTYKIRWDKFLEIILHLADKVSDHFMDD